MKGVIRELLLQAWIFLQYGGQTHCIHPFGHFLLAFRSEDVCPHVGVLCLEGKLFADAIFADTGVYLVAGQ